MIDKSTFDLIASVIKPATAEYIEAYNAIIVPGSEILNETHIGKRLYFYLVDLTVDQTYKTELRTVWEHELDEMLAELSKTHEFGSYSGTGQYLDKMPHFIEKPKPAAEDPVAE